MKKISEEQYVLDCINKEYELCGSDKRFETFKELSDYSKKNPQWFDEVEFPDEPTYKVWTEYCKQHIYDWKPKRTNKRVVEQHVSCFALNYGFPCRFRMYEAAKEKDNKGE